MNKIEEFSSIFAQYSESIRSILNIISINLDDDYFEVNRTFLICKFEYQNYLTNELYTNWIKRHAFIDLFELTREIIFLIVLELYGNELSFKNKKNKSSKELKNKQLTRMSIDDIFKILQLEEKFHDFLRLLKEYKKIRDALTHRFGAVSSRDKPPLQMHYYTVKHNLIIKDKLYEFDNPSEANKILNEHYNEDNRDDEDISITVSFKHHLKKFTHGERIIISEENIYGIAGFLHSNVKNILQVLLNSFIPNLSKILELRDPFRLKYEINLKKMKIKINV